ncbi:hypothetical protein SAMN05428988_0612 [Chitinophaga sp. YR573]|uniref:hypothetical protein n=1 Tax=Chitinophaga sp. YR573 TaxID=1881040 RepID=UPI0008B4CBF7|nr:hypothetical protein [Chitinophaga sp. YR573]SEV93756.1 hypothetical protein SAMN05428988_0612 [Chitinophaga sp. YR573]
MKTLILFITGLALCVATKAQEVIKLRPDDTMKDSITYQTPTSILVINKVDLQNYFQVLDTMLQNNCYNNRTFRNIQFNHLTPAEMQAHFLQAKAYLADSSHTEFNYNTDKFTMFWTPNEGILLPYIEELLTTLLTDARIKVIDRASKASVPQYSIFYEDINGQPFKIYKLPTGKIFFKESNFYIEQYVQTKS